jgi:hypothetical protein
VALDPVGDALFPWVIAIAEHIARAIAEAFHVTGARAERTIQFLVYILVICPVLLLVAAALVALVTWLVGLA